MTYDVIVYGPLFCDLIFTDMEEMPKLGKEIFAGGFTIALGGSAIVAAGLHRLGANVGLAVDLGNDILNRVLRQMLEELGIDSALIRQHARPLTQLSVALSFPEDRALIARYEKPADPINLENALREHPAKHVHVSGFLGVYNEPDACRIAHEADATISMDPGWDETALRDPCVLDMVKDLDFFLPSRSELTFMMEEDDAEKALRKALKHMNGGTIIMKNGKEGVTARGKDLNESVPTLNVDPIDTTGAGDSFDAGFLYAYTQGYSIQESMRYGVICGALATQAVGGAAGTPTLEEVQQRLPELEL